MIGRFTVHYRGIYGSIKRTQTVEASSPNEARRIVQDMIETRIIIDKVKALR